MDQSTIVSKNLREDKHCQSDMELEMLQWQATFLPPENTHYKWMFDGYREDQIVNL